MAKISVLSNEITTLKFNENDYDYDYDEEGNMKKKVYNFL